MVAPLGAGGMGEVWRATDTRLGRNVALKLLPAAFASDPDAWPASNARRSCSRALAHPHRRPLRARGGDPRGQRDPGALPRDGARQGEDLAERLKRGAIPVDEALAIAKQIAEALEAAHEKGIVHRDLKPANVKVSAEGHVKVLDFGLAKAWSNEGDGASDSSDWSQSPTLARTGTAAGLILGTAAYMAPEQARGKPVDKRADIWAFGVVLFEMLTGKRLFDGETVSDVLAAVLTREPQWNELPSATPPSVRRLLRHCLERNPKNRQHDIADVRVALDEALRGVPEEAAAGALPQPAPLLWRALPWAVAGALALVLVLGRLGALEAGRGSGEGRAPERRAGSGHVARDDGLRRRGGRGRSRPTAACSLSWRKERPAGRPQQLYVRPLDQLQASPLPGTENARNPFFSPDGQWLAFFAGGKLKKVAVTGGAAVTLCDAPDDRGGTWIDDRTIVFAPQGRSGLSRVSADGGVPEVVTSLDPADAEITHRWPQALPGGRAVLYTAHSQVGDFEGASLVVQPLPSGPRRIVHRGGYHGRYLAERPPGLHARRDAVRGALRYKSSRTERTACPGATWHHIPLRGSRGRSSPSRTGGRSCSCPAGASGAKCPSCGWAGKAGRSRCEPSPPLQEPPLLSRWPEARDGHPGGKPARPVLSTNGSATRCRA